MYRALITIQGHIADHRYLAAVFHRAKIDWPSPSGKGDNTYWYREVTSDDPALLKKWSRKFLAIAMSALKARNRGTRGNLVISKDGTVWYEEQVTPEGPRVLVDKIENPIDSNVYKHGARIYAPGAPTYVPRGTVIGKKGDIVIVQLDRKKGFHGGTITRSGTLDIALSPTESWSYEPFTKNPNQEVNMKIPTHIYNEASKMLADKYEEAYSDIESDEFVNRISEAQADIAEKLKKKYGVPKYITHYLFEEMDQLIKVVPGLISEPIVLSEKQIKEATEAYGED